MVASVIALGWALSQSPSPQAYESRLLGSSPPRKEVVADTPYLKLLLDDDQYRTLHKLQPGTAKILKSRPLPNSGGLDGHIILITHPKNQAFALSINAIGMTQDIRRAVVFDKDFNALPIDIANVFGMSATGVLGAPDVDRSQEKRSTTLGPLAFFDTETGRTVWRRWDITQSHSPYSVDMTDQHAIVRHSFLNCAIEVLDLQTGKTIYTDPPRNMKVGTSTVNLWPQPQRDNQFDLTRLANGVNQAAIIQGNEAVTFWNSPSRLLSIGKSNGRPPFVLYDHDLETKEPRAAITLPSWFQDLSHSQLINSPDSSVFAINLNSHINPQERASIIFYDNAPLLQLPGVELLSLCRDLAIGRTQDGNQNYVVKIDPTTGKTLWRSADLGANPSFDIKESRVLISHVLENNNYALTLINLETGRIIWEKTDLPWGFGEIREDHIIFGQPTSIGSEAIHYLLMDLATGAIVQELTIERPEVPERFLNPIPPSNPSTHEP